MVHVSIASADQWEDVRDVRLRALTADPDAFGATLAQESAFGPDDWRAFIDSCYVLVARVNGVIGAMITVDTTRHDGGTDAWLGGLWVDPTYRSQGLFRALIAFIDAHAATHQWRSLALGVFVENVAARAVFRAVGFTEYGDAEESWKRPPLMFQCMVRWPDRPSLD